MEVNMMARRWCSLSRRGVRSSSDDPFLLRTHGDISVHPLHPLKGGRILTYIGVQLWRSTWPSCRVLRRESRSMEATDTVSARMGVWRILSTAVNRKTSSTFFGWPRCEPDSQSKVSMKETPWVTVGFLSKIIINQCTKGPEDIDFCSLIPPCEERGRIFKANQYSQEVSSATSRLVHVVRPALPHIAALKDLDGRSIILWYSALAWVANPYSPADLK